MTGQTIRVLVADDHPVFRKGVIGVLAEDSSLEVVGEASDGDEALVVAAACRPDVVLMDLHMAGVGGVDATRRLVEAQPEVAALC
jgi:DNA-binding NarL/FixJ family response regulator